MILSRACFVGRMNDQIGGEIGKYHDCNAMHRLLSFEYAMLGSIVILIGLCTALQRYGSF